MATRTQTIKVGVFLIMGLALITAIFTTVSMKNRQPTETYYMAFNESVSGLGKDCTVLYRGVPVGKVEEVKVNDKNEVIVSVGIVTSHVTLRNGTFATLVMANLMGIMQIELSGGDPGAPEIPPGSMIPSKVSILENVTHDLPKILERIAAILAKIDESIGDVKGNRLGSLVRNADSTIQTADRTFSEMTTFLQTTRGTMLNTEYEVTQTMRALREAIVKADRLINQLNENPSAVFWGRSIPLHPHMK
ncbi:MAG: MlaD family protein [Candidatus Aureabacteria bacterium]|nr:MlaD family protein [Candidatus Auribacterota bacterium]